MSSKKKNNVIECPKCICYLHAKDLEVHQKECFGKGEFDAADLLSSTVKIVVPFVGMIVANQNLENSASFLPPDLIGWEKWNTVLVHPETMSKLHILPREPCLLTDTDAGSSARCVTIWPCDQVKEMQICIQKARVSGKFRIIIGKKIKKVFVVRLRPSSGGHFLQIYSRLHFNNYLKTYLSNGYLGIGVPISVHYYGQEHSFDVVLSDEERFKMLNISPKSSLLLLKPAPECTFHIIDNTTARPSLTFNDFGGAKKVKRDVENLMINPLKEGKKAFSLILSGDTGCGKTLFLRIVGNYLQNKALQLSREEFEDFLENGVNTDQEKMAVLIDNFDSLVHCSEKLCRFMDANDNFIFLLAVRNIEALELPLRRRFRYELQLPVPSLVERIEILDVLLKWKYPSLTTAHSLIRNVAQKTHGYTGDDLKAVCDSVYSFLDTTDDTSVLEHFDDALKRIRPTGIRQFVLEVPDVSWDDIGGNRELKLEIEQAIVWPYQYPDLFERFATKPPSGILLYGPPGCSKTLIARAIASQSRMNFLAVKGPELFSKWVGESERAVRELFRRARQVAPAIIFFDEIDAVGASRGERSESHVGERVLTQLLTELDGLERKGDVMVLAATNRPDRLDSALLRPGRLDLAIHVPLPDEKTRRAILLIRLNRMKVDVHVDIEALAVSTKGFSGAEVVELCERAARIAMLENREAERIESRHFDKAMEKIVPRTDKKLLNIYEKFEKGAL